MFVASCFPLRSGKESGTSDLCHIIAVNMNYQLDLRDEYHAIRWSNGRKENEKVYEQARRNVNWIRFSYGDSVKCAWVLETDRLMHGTESGKPLSEFKSGSGLEQHVLPREVMPYPLPRRHP